MRLPAPPIPPRPGFLSDAAMVFLRVAGLAAVLCVLYMFFANERAGFILLGALAVASLAAGLIVVLSYQDEAIQLEAAFEGPPVTKAVRPARVPAQSATPLAAAVAVGLILAGALYGVSLALVGIIVAIGTVVAWAAVNAGEHRRSPVNLLPIAIPVLAAAAIASFLFLMSRILLAVPEQASTFVAILIAVFILAGGFLVANKPQVPARTIVRALAALFVLFFAGGMAAYAAGQRAEEHLGGPEPQTVVARDIAFQEKHLDWEAGQDVSVDFKNEDTVPHNIHFAADDTYAVTIYKKDPLPGPSETSYKFTAPSAGDYVYRCDVHPNMTGTVTVTGEGGDAPGTASTTTTIPGGPRNLSTNTTKARHTETTKKASGGAAPAAAAKTTVSLVAKGLEFDKKTLALKANSDVDIRFNNQDALPHNVHVSTEEGGGGKTIFREDPFSGPKTVDYLFRTPPPGRLYFVCDVHPNMKGTINVT